MQLQVSQQVATAFTAVVFQQARKDVFSFTPDITESYSWRKFGV